MKDLLPPPPDKTWATLRPSPAEPIPATVFAVRSEQPVAPSNGCSKNTSCVTCGGYFGDAAEYRQHFRYYCSMFSFCLVELIYCDCRSDWHRYNLQQKLKMEAAKSAGHTKITAKILSYEDFKDLPAEKLNL